MKSILVHVADDPCLEARVQVALDLGRSFDAHVTFLHTIPYIYAVPIDIYGMSLANAMPQVRAAAQEVRDMFEKRLQNEDVAWDWVSVEGPADARILSAVNTYDLLVLGGCDPFEVLTQHSSLAADMAVNAHTPILVVPQAQEGLNCTGPAVVAWDGSAESSRALRAAVPFLQLAEEVSLISVEDGPKGKTYDLPATAGAEYLSRHGIESEIVRVRRGDSDTTECLLTAARERRASFIVMGAYGHSRMRESLLGGVTKRMLTDPAFPLLMHH